MTDHKKKPRKSITRRKFLKDISGTLAGTVAISSTGILLGAESTPPPEVRSGVIHGRVPIDLTVNGASHSLLIEPRTTLADALRMDLDLTGTKVICDRGECGGCTVLIEGKPVYACMTLAIEAQGLEIKTIEGLSSNGEIEPIQKAFIEHDALMCGFCTPGFLMATHVYLKENPTPNSDQIKAAISGNICRCGTHQRIVEATLDVAGKSSKDSGK